MCECPSGACVAVIELTMLEYEAAHTCPSWLAVAPGHHDDGTVLVPELGFWIMELPSG